MSPLPHTTLPKILVITGSRSLTSAADLHSHFARIFPAWCPSMTTIRIGDAKGVDRIAYTWLQNHPELLQHATLQQYKPDWKKYGQSAGLIRNNAMLQGATHVIAFWDEKSRGTKHTIDQGRHKGCIVKVVCCTP